MTELADLPPAYQAQARAKLGVVDQPRAKPPRQESPLEAKLAAQLDNAGITGWTREHRFAPPRRWRFDLAWVDRKLALEVDGGTWTAGRHTRHDGYRHDAEKLNAAALAGWTVLRFTGDMVDEGVAIATVRAALEATP